MISAINNNSNFKPAFTSNFENLVEMSSQKTIVQKAINTAINDITSLVGGNDVNFTLKEGKRIIPGLGEVKGFLLTCKIIRPEPKDHNKLYKNFLNYLDNFIHGKKIKDKTNITEIIDTKFITHNHDADIYFNAANTLYIKTLKKFIGKIA